MDVCYRHNLIPSIQYMWDSTVVGMVLTLVSSGGTYCLYSAMVVLLCIEHRFGNAVLCCDFAVKKQDGGGSQLRD